MTQAVTGWKFLRLAGEQIVSAADRSAWQIGQWREVAGQIRCCERGFHCSQTPLDALQYVYGGAVAQVEADGASDTAADKSAHARMRILRAWRWTKEDSVHLAVFVAELVLHLYEQQYPDDHRPHAAIAAAKTYLDNPTNAAADAAHTAAEAAAKAAVEAADDDAYTATYAADAAEAAAEAAVRAVEAAARAAEAAAEAAARAACAADRAVEAACAADRAAPEADDVKQRVAEWMVGYIERYCQPLLPPTVAVAQEEAQ